MNSKFSDSGTGQKFSVSGTGPKIQEFLQKLIASAGFALSFSVEPGDNTHPEFENPDVAVKFTGPDVDLLLGNRAELLLALELVTQDFLRLHSDDHSRISFDANDYRALRIEELRAGALAAADRVKASGAPFRFNPMNSRERRVIHIALRNEPAVRSESAGAGPQRGVMIYPAGMPSLPEPVGPPPQQYTRRPVGGPPRPGHGGVARSGHGGPKRPGSGRPPQGNSSR